MSSLTVKCEVKEGEEIRPMTVHGRMAWALLRLVEAGPAGLTTLKQPAPRWSDYIFKLRKAGISIETETESHAGQFAGHHGRYRLLTSVRIVEVIDNAESEAA